MARATTDLVVDQIIEPDQVPAAVTSSTEDEVVDPGGPVLARWVDQQAVFVPGQGLIRYGDPIEVSPEQLAQGSHPTIVWSDDWTPDPAVLAAATKEG